MWTNLTKPWQVCFEQAWESYCNGSIPIGAVLLDDAENVVLVGRNRVYEKKTPYKQIGYSKIAHAEMNVLLQIDIDKYPNIRNYTLYTTMEPCPLCFGAIVMSNVRKVKYAARDRIAGSANLNNGNDFIASKSIKVYGPEIGLEEIQMTIKTDYVLKNWGAEAERLLTAWRQDCPKGIEIGEKWFTENRLQLAKNKKVHISVIVDEIEKELRKL